MARSAAEHDADTRKALRGREPAWLRAYMARMALRLIVANKELQSQHMVPLLSPGLEAALRTLRPLAGAPTGRKKMEDADA